VAVAGSSNKTFIKDQILEEMKNEEGVRGNPRSFNTEIGLPLAVLFLPSGYSSIFKWVDVLLAGSYISIFKRDFPKVLVLEMGVQKKNDMKYLLSIVKPKIAVISDIDQNFSNNKKIIDQEMGLLVEAVPKDGKIVLNMDNARVKELSRKSKAPVIFFGKNKKSEIKIGDIKETSTGQSFSLIFDKKKENYKTSLFGLHNIYALVAAKTVVNEIRKTIKNPS
jgi:UDP-N-acetylmuramoyl-tripeptide--D-alanyl-D-alanine ligase